MKFNYLKKITDKTSLQIDKDGFVELINSQELQNRNRATKAAVANGEMEVYRKIKSQLPSIMWCGCSNKGSRKASELTPTGYYMIDLDHLPTPYEAWSAILGALSKRGMTKESLGIVVVHETPSGQGLRIVARRSLSQGATLAENMAYLYEEISNGVELSLGDFDTCTSDLSRQSYLVHSENIYYWDSSIFEGEQPQEQSQEDNANTEATPARIDNPPEEKDYSEEVYRGVKLKTIIERYIEVFGTPEVGERHNYYNDMVKNFRCICNNNPRILHQLLPRFGNDEKETWNQCKAITNSNKTTRIPRTFYFFLIDNGFYPKRWETRDEIDNILNAETEEDVIETPVFPPVFREYCSICPPEFVYPTIVSLLPILGTLTTYVRGRYIDGEEHSTSFFSVVYAPPSSGKSFIDKFTRVLFSRLLLRDEVSNLRENLYLEKVQNKADNEQAPPDPHVSTRIMPAINSQPEFLQKMKDNKGLHMFTQASEIDTFNKGTRAAGGDKSDMFRIAWDNGLYGQSFKSKTTFKGQVKLYYNTLLTGTYGQLRKYYKNVEDGMVTRVCFCEIRNQEFARPPIWKQLSERQMEVIEKFVERTDLRTYGKSLEADIEEASTYELDEFDKHVDWRFNPLDPVEVDMSRIIDPILKWLEKERMSATVGLDYARDTFRKRAAVKGFRLAMVCTQLWDKPNATNWKTIEKFVLWFMSADLRESLRLFGEQFNEKMNENAVNAVSIQKATVFEKLKDEFEKNDLLVELKKQGYRTPVSAVLHKWKKSNLITKISNGKYRKINSKVDSQKGK